MSDGFTGDGLTGGGAGSDVIVSAGTLIIEDGSIVAGANSFVTALDVFNHAALIGQSDAWAAQAAVVQEQAIIRAMQTLRRYEERFRGWRVSASQTLPWPRYGALVNAYELASNVVPEAIKEATAELAIRELTARATMPDEIVSADGAIVESSREIGPLKKRDRYATAKGRGRQPYYPTVMAILRPYLTSVGSLMQH